jgi:hypothetical protein
MSDPTQLQIMTKHQTVATINFHTAEDQTVIIENQPRHDRTPGRHHG